MKKDIFTGILFMLVTLGCFSQAPTVFVHPGLFSSQAELDSLKSLIHAGGSHPQVTGYNLLAAKSWGSLTYLATPYADVHVVASGIGDEERAFRQDGHAMYIHAIKWVVTGDTAHRDKAIQIADAWGSTFNSLLTEPAKPNQPTLEASWAVPIWIAGAEILKYYNNGESGWSSDAFESFIDKLITYVNGPIFTAPNWQISKFLSLMSIGVFREDATIYNQGYNGVKTQVDAITAAGAIPELTRDFEHSQYVMIGLTQCAEIAYQQGDPSLFTRTGERLRVGAEAYTRSVMGLQEPNYLSASSKKRKSAPYEILLNRYTKLGLAVPNVQTYVLTMNRPENDIEEHFLGWFTATHAIEPELPSSVPLNKPAGTINLYPNPAGSNINVQSKTIINSVTVFNLLGSLMIERTGVNDKEINLELPVLRKGIYVCRVTDQYGEIFCRRFSVE